MRTPWEKFRAQISLDLSFTASQDVPYGSETSQSADKCRMMITLQKIPQTDGPTPANKTQLSEWPQALRISWIEPPSRWWCTLAGNIRTVWPTTFWSARWRWAETRMVWRSLSSPRPSCGTRWVDISPLSSSQGFVQQNPQTEWSREITNANPKPEWRIGAPQPLTYTFLSNSLLS